MKDYTRMVAMPMVPRTTEDELKMVQSAMEPPGQGMPTARQVEQALQSRDPMNHPAVNQVLQSWSRRVGQPPTEVDDMVRDALSTDGIVEAYDHTFNGDRINNGREGPDGRDNNDMR